jgi:hypothetical protein
LHIADFIVTQTHRHLTPIAAFSTAQETLQYINPLTGVFIVLSLFTTHAESVASPTFAALPSVYARSVRIGSRTRAATLGVVAAAAMALTPAFATAPNTTAAASVPYEVGHGWVTHYFDENVQTRWFRYGEVGGHSYCVEAVRGKSSCGRNISANSLRRLPFQQLFC